MELKRIEIMGFKSFPEKISIEFSRGITAIVGPNGSGKSNISDAIRWVLGEQSARTLRGSKMEDVIFAGTERRRPLSYAEVTLVLDNSDHRISLDYDELSVKRRVFRSGESEYVVNGTKYRLKDIQEMLMDTGIGKSGYSIIGQGHIDQLLSNRPQERRLIFEEAAGIVKFKARRDEALKQLEAERQSLVRVDDRLHEIGARLPDLEAQAEKAKTFQAMQEELKTYEIHHFLSQFQKVREQYDQAEHNLNDLKASLEEADEKRKEAKAESSRLAEEAESARKAAGENDTALSEARIRLESLDADKRLKEQEKAQLEQQIETAGVHIREIKERLQRLTETVEAEEELLQKLEAEDQEKEALQKEQETKDRSLSGELLEAGQRLLELQNQAEEVSRQETGLENQLSGLRALLEQHEGQAEGADVQIESLKQQADKIREEEEKLKGTLEDLLAQHDATDDALQQALTDQSSLREKVRQLHEEQASHLLLIRQLQDKIRLLEDLEAEYEGYAGSVRAVMRLGQGQNRVQYGIRGTVGELITVPQELAVAYQVALGAGVGNIIVDRQSDAKRLIAWLKKNNGGRVTFQPLDTVRGRDHGSAEARVRRMMAQDAKILGYADELIQYDEAFRSVISRLLGNVVVVEDFDTGAALSRTENAAFRIVTVSGELFNIGGSITGGSTTHEGGVLGRRAELEETREALKQAQQKNDVFRQRGQEQSRQSEAAAARVQELRETLLQIEKQQQDTREAEIRVHTQLEQADEQVLKYEQEHSELQGAAEDVRAEIASLEAKLAEVSEQHQRLKKETTDSTDRQAALREQAEVLRDALTELELARGSIAGQQKSIRRTMEWEYNELEDYSSQADTWLGQNEAQRERIREITKEIEEVTGSQETLRQQILQLQKESTVLSEQQRSTEAEREEKIAQTEEATWACAELEKEQVRLEAVYNRARKDMTTLQDNIWDKYELTYHAARQMELSVNLTPAEVSRRISKLTHEMRDLGPVNIDAIEEYETLSERFRIDTAQREDIQKAEASLEEVIRHLNRKMEQQFTEKFTQIAASFDKVFQKLFGGGKGILKLSEDPDATALEAGIEIIAQPPGKKLQNMMLLSGGERALTAIALLFAIQELSPAPFCVLDEIDAALDDSNVTRYAAYLTELSKKTQYIVITHRRGTMEAAHTMYGVTMEEKGISKGFSMQFTKSEEMEWIRNGTV